MVNSPIARLIIRDEVVYFIVVFFIIKTMKLQGLLMQIQVAVK